MRSKVRLCAALAVVAPVVAGCASTVAPITTAATTTAAGTTTTTSTSASTSTATNTAASSVAAGGTASAIGASAQFPIPTGYDADRNATADIQAALGLAKTSRKEVLLDFGADWCPDCVALDTMFHSTQVESLLDSDYVVVPIDVGDWNLNISTAGQYVDLTTSGIPALVVISGTGQVRETTNDGSFSNARTMDPDQVANFLTTWAPGSSQ